MDKIDEKQLQKTGTGSIALHEGDSENAVLTRNKTFQQGRHINT